MGFKARISGFALLSWSVAAIACQSEEPADDEGADTGGTTGGSESSTGSDSDPITTTLMTSAGTMPPPDDEDTGDPDESDSGDGATTDGGDTMGDTTGAPELDCASYCEVYMGACSDYSDYANTEDCMDHCTQWPLGTMKDVDGDSLGCRIYHATVASSLEPDFHCPHAAPNGGGVCAEEKAPDCMTYCSTYMGNCTGDNGVYVDMDDCLDQCEPWYQGTDADLDGNTVGCRIYHAGAPAFGDPELHCPHAGPGGAGVCAFPG